MLFDSHSHFHGEKFDDDRDAALERAHAAGVSRILTLGVDIEESRRAIALAEKHPEIFAAAGFHPSSAAGWNDEAAAALETLLDHPRVPVLGEIGIDYYWNRDPVFVEQQHRAFREQLRMARRRGLPVSIHSRDANADVLKILGEEHGDEIGGVLHCFAGTEEDARRGIEMGFFLGVGGTSTYPKSEDLRIVLRSIGVDHLIVETDAPYLPPQPKRGKRNEPAFVRISAERLAETLGIPFEECAARTYANTLKAFRLEE
ncbi:hypothetical protein BH09SUM1_BH09SUM1_23880 [soil metagenome]